MRLLTNGRKLDFSDHAPASRSAIDIFTQRHNVHIALLTELEINKIFLVTVYFHRIYKLLRSAVG